MSGADVIRSLLRSDNGIRISESRCTMLEVRTQVWTASGMGHWREM